MSDDTTITVRIVACLEVDRETTSSVEEVFRLHFTVPREAMQPRKSLLVDVTAAITAAANQQLAEGVYSFLDRMLGSDAPVERPPAGDLN